MGQQSAQLVNCKKCGTLFVKSSNRDICDNCYKQEVEWTDTIKNFIHTSGKAKVPLEEIIQGTGLEKDDVEHLFEKGKLFGVMNKISIKCRFCGIEFECEQKPSFVCPNCINKFTKKELGKINGSFEEKQKQVKARKSSSIAGASSRYGFIQNFEL
ncbi:hypothetical protein IKA92_03925 [bacterium]|nr:hypothetical protein [bacterium]